MPDGKTRPSLMPALTLAALGLSAAWAPGASAAAVMVVDPLVEIRGAEDIPAAPDGGTLRLVGPRNGFCSAQVVVTGADPANVRATATPLRGPGTIPTEAVRVRYAAVSPPPPLEFGAHSEGSDPTVLTPYCDVLQEEPPADAAVLPVWVTVAIPPDAPPGDYSGMLAVAGAQVPVALHVGRWLCPGPNEWVTHVGLLSSPETLAMQYGVGPWSEEHWRLVGRELDLLAGLGSDDLWLSVLPGNSLGQERPWITFRKTAAGYEPDLALAERYTRTYAERIGEPQYAMVYLWEDGLYGYGYKKRSDEKGQVALMVDGEVAKLPAPAAPGGEAVWAPLMEGIRSLVRERGWDERVITLGCASDVRPVRETVEFFAEHAPYARWAVWTHGRDAWVPEGQRNYDILSDDAIMRFTNGMDVSYYSFVDAPAPSPGERPDGIQGGWDVPFRRFFSFRNYLAPYTHLEQWRTLADACMATRRGEMHPLWAAHADPCGFAFVAFDYWPVSRGEPLLSRYGRGFRTLMRNNTQWLAAPGPDGPIATVRYEMLREGLQECEARIALEKALAAGKVPGDLAEKARTLLAERIQVRTKGGKVQGGHTGNVLAAEVRRWGVAANWQDSTASLFDVAGEALQTTEAER